MRNDAPAPPVRVDPGDALGKELLQLLESRRAALAAAAEAAAAAPPAVRRKSLDAPRRAGGGGDDRKGSGKAQGGKVSRGAELYAAAYPEAEQLLGATIQGLKSGRIRLWVVPFRALNPEGCPPQVG
jgi:hypothetical protein